MNFGLQEKLFRHYPKLFRKPGSEGNPAPVDERGVECGDGWFDLIDRLCRACESEIETLSLRHVARERWPRVAQIKEKFGTLRFYVHGQLSDGLRAQILQAEEAESARTCERCGAPGQLRNGGWRHTYCDDCDAVDVASGTAAADPPFGDHDQGCADLLALLASRHE